MYSKELLEKSKQAYYNVQHKEYTKRSFIAGYLIGYAEQLRQSNVVKQSEQLKCDHEWKFKSFDQFGFPIEKYCENCGDVEAL